MDYSQLPCQDQNLKVSLLICYDSFDLIIYRFMDYLILFLVVILVVVAAFIIMYVRSETVLSLVSGGGGSIR